MITVGCKSCGTTYNLGEEWAGKAVRCKKCGGTFQATAIAEPAAVPVGRAKDKIEYDCPKCKGKLENPGTMGGRQDKCPLCGFGHLVPLSKFQEKELERRKAAEWRLPAPVAPPGIAGPMVAEAVLAGPKSTRRPPALIGALVGMGLVVVVLGALVVWLAMRGQAIGGERTKQRSDDTGQIASAKPASPQEEDNRKKAEAEKSRIATEEAKKAEAERSRIAREDARKAAEEQKNKEKLEQEKARIAEEAAKKERLAKDPATSFERFAKEFVDRFPKGWSDRTDNIVINAKFDVKRTDSLVVPIVGELSFGFGTKRALEVGVVCRMIMKFSFSNGEWNLLNCLYGQHDVSDIVDAFGGHTEQSDKVHLIVQEANKANIAGQ